MRRILPLLILPLLLGATDQQPEKGSVSVVPAVSPTHAFPTGKATNGNVGAILTDDAGAVVLSNPGSGGGGSSGPTTVTNGDAGVLWVYFDGGTVTATNSAFGVSGQGNTETVTDGGELLVSLPAITLAPSGTTTKTAVSTGSAQAAAGYAVGTCLRLMCDVDVFYSVGLVDGGAATTSNVPLPQKTVEKWCLDGQKVNVAFITASGTGSCYTTAVPKIP